jgi:hypothetical protein
MPRPTLALWASLLLVLVSCSRRSEDLPVVTGQVFLHGKPLTGGTIVFTPDSERGGSGPLATGVIGSDGRYSLTTEGRRGAVPGWHRVSVAALRNPPDGPPLPDHYHDPEQSGQSCEVKSGMANSIDLHLE